MLYHVYWSLESEQNGVWGKIRKWKNVKFAKQKLAEFDIYKAGNSGPYISN